MRFFRSIESSSRRLIETLNKIGVIRLTLYTVAISLIFNILITLILNNLGISVSKNFGSFKNPKDEFLTVVILAPLLETLIFQSFLIDLTLYLTGKIFKAESVFLGILIPSICFGLNHYYNLFYILVTIVLGSIFNVFYMNLKFRKQYPYMYTAVVHSLCNLTVFTLKHL